MAAMQGLAPYVSSARPRDPPRWWSAEGTLDGDRVGVSLQESDAPPPVAAPCGIAAPCSLPAPFLAFLGVGRSIDALVPPDRLFRRAREFAAQAPRGQKHPLRFPHESLPALDRRRLPLFLAALPLLRSDAARFLIEIDVAAALRAAGLPHAQLGGAIPASVDRRARVLAGLAEGALGLRVEALQRDYAVASFHALAAVVACAMAARVHSRGDLRPADAEAWVPLP